MNTLNDRAPNLNTQYRVLREKPYDLTGDHAARTEQHSSKRRRIGNGHVLSHGASEEAINVDLNDTERGSGRDSYDPRSTQSQVRNGASTSDLSGGIKEYRSVEDIVRVRNRTSRKRPRSQHSRHGSPEGTKPQGASGRRNSRRTHNGQTGASMDMSSNEDPTDPIIDDTREDDKTGPKFQSQRNMTSKTARVVVISPSNSENANHRRPMFILSDEQEEPDSSSKYFDTERSTTAYNRTSRAQEPENIMRMFRSTKLPPRSLNHASDRRGETRSADPEHGFDDSLDPLSAFPYTNGEAEDYQMAHNLLTQRRRLEDSSSRTRRARQSESVNLTDEDELQTLDHVNIKSTTFTKSGKPSQKTSSTEQYQVAEAFSQGREWVSTADTFGGKLSFTPKHLNIDGPTRVTFTLNSFQRLQWCAGHPRVKVFKAQNTGSGNDAHIYLTFASAALSESFVNRLESLGVKHCPMNGLVKQIHG